MAPQPTTTPSTICGARRWGFGHPEGVASPFVDYEAAARAYARRRAPTRSGLDAWERAIGAHVRGAGTVVDLGAGAGGFSNALRSWGARRVVAVEPSAAMRAEATPASGIHQVAGRAEAMPLRHGCAGLVWISTAFHHFEDPAEAVLGCGRVLVDEGWVVVRGFVPGHSRLEWLELFPGWAKAVARFPDLEEMDRLFRQAGFHLVQDGLVEEARQSYGARAEFSRMMRRSDSILTALSDAEVDAGIAALQERRDQVEHLSLSCLVYGRGPRPRGPG